MRVWTLKEEGKGEGRRRDSAGAASGQLITRAGGLGKAHLQWVVMVRLAAPPGGSPLQGEKRISRELDMPELSLPTWVKLSSKKKHG